MRLQRSMRAFVCALFALLVATDAFGAARIEIQSQTDTALTLRCFDRDNLPYVVSFARPTANDTWKATTTESLGIVFGNGNPRYAGAAARRALGITPAQSIRTLDSSITTRPMDDLTVFQTFEAIVIALWQQGAITEIWYAGTFVDEALDLAQADEDGSMCDAVLAMCCATTPLPIPPGGQVPSGDMDACGAALACPNHKAQACACLDAACDLCDHPGPDPDCTPAEQQMSNRACILGAPACQEPPPPHVPDYIEDILDLLQEILDRLQQIIDNLVN